VGNTVEELATLLKLAVAAQSLLCMSVCVRLVNVVVGDVVVLVNGWKITFI